MKFLEKIIDELLTNHQDLSNVTIVIPGKRPIVFIKNILQSRNYNGFLPNFYTIEELIVDITEKQLLQGTSIWLFAYQVYLESPITRKDNFGDFLKWFPTVLKDWDDMLKFSNAGDKAILEYLLDEERIRDWAQDLGDDDEVPRKKFLDFWKNMNIYLPILKAKLLEKNWATSGMIHELAREEIKHYAERTQEKYVFCGFNALTPIEELLIRQLLQWDKAICYFQADDYYLNDYRQEAGKFLRQHSKWKEFTENRPFNWLTDEMRQEKNINLYEVSGNITQAKLLPSILQNLGAEDVTDTAIVLLDENLLPATIDSVANISDLNITMGFPLKNLSFSNGIKHLFYLHKQIEKGKSSYYNKDLFCILDEIPRSHDDSKQIAQFRSLIEKRNIIYISPKLLEEHLGALSYYSLLLKPSSIQQFLQELIDFCSRIKSLDIDDIQYENISHFEKTFTIILNQLSEYSLNVDINTLEVFINQYINSENIDFMGEPLSGLQLMGLLETRLLNFKNVIMLSINEGKLPLGNTQNTYIPFDVRNHFEMHTFIENDSIYAYHFYRLLQSATNIHLAYNALSSGVNTGEKSRFITQLEMESGQTIQKFIIENSSSPILHGPMKIEKTPLVIHRLNEWKSRVSASHLTSYLYDPMDFYFNKVLKTHEVDEIEEELSIRNYGNLVHYSLQVIYERLIGTCLDINILQDSIKDIDNSMDKAIELLQHLPEYYKNGMNYIHKTIARRVIENILRYDLRLVEKGHQLRILDVERKFEDCKFSLPTTDDIVNFYGYIDRIDELDGTIRVIDYKTGKTKKLLVKLSAENQLEYFLDNDKKQALQLCIYQYVLQHFPEFSGKPIQTGIWSFSDVNKGVVPLQFLEGELPDAMKSIGYVIEEILDPDIPFEESVKVEFNLN